MNIDETNREIIRQLRDGRKSFDEIAKKLSITPNTVRARVKRLIAAGVLDITGELKLQLTINNNEVTMKGQVLKYK